MQQNCTASHCPTLWSKGWELSDAAAQQGSGIHLISSMSLVQMLLIARQHQQGV